MIEKTIIHMLKLFKEEIDTCIIKFITIGNNIPNLKTHYPKMIMYLVWIY